MQSRSTLHFPAAFLCVYMYEFCTTSAYLDTCTASLISNCYIAEYHRGVDVAAQGYELTRSMDHRNTEAAPK